MPNYDLSSIEAVTASAKLARTIADQEPSQSSYNAAWLHGYAAALADTARQLEPRLITVIPPHKNHSSKEKRDHKYNER
ncbi:MAG: hypothetical protein HFF62_05425 [Oscillospiraceae bacterium]|nr:hypothetical protein [Oscillospiraceae bacterium]